MPKVAVLRGAADEARNTFLKKGQDLCERIRARAYELSQSRVTDRSADDDWLEAERQLTIRTSCDLTEKDGRFELRIPMPGFKASQIEVTALADSLLVEAQCTQEQEGTGGDVRYCETLNKYFTQEVPLPGPIDSAKVTASLRDSVLLVSAARAGSSVKGLAAAA